MKSNEIKQYTPLLIELLKRDIKVKYRKSVLGVLWSVLNPLFMMIILSVVFSTLFKNNVENYPTYIFSGQLIYNFFSEATTSSMSAIVDNASLIKKIYVPKYLFVLARICSSMINLMATLSALFCVMLVLRIDLSYRLYEGVVALILLTLFSTGVGLVLSAIAVKFRDMMHLYSVFLTALMYLCPIIYTMSFLPERVQKIVMLNPLTHFLIIFRECVLYEENISIKILGVGVLETFIMLGIGIYVFGKRQDKFIMARQNPRAEPQYAPTCLLHSLAYRNHFPIHALNLLRFSDYTKAHLHQLVFLVCKPDSSRLQSIDSAA